MQGNYQIKKTHIYNIRIGDIVRCKDGLIRTVGKESFNYIHGIGRTLFGESYKLGYEPVELVQFVKSKTN